MTKCSLKRVYIFISKLCVNQYISYASYFMTLVRKGDPPPFTAQLFAENKSPPPTLWTLDMTLEIFSKRLNKAFWTTKG